MISKISKFSKTMLSSMVLMNAISVHGSQEPDQADETRERNERYDRFRYIQRQSLRGRPREWQRERQTPLPWTGDTVCNMRIDLQKYTYGQRKWIIEHLRNVNLSNTSNRKYANEYDAFTEAKGVGKATIKEHIEILSSALGGLRSIDKLFPNIGGTSPSELTKKVTSNVGDLNMIRVDNVEFWRSDEQGNSDPTPINYNEYVGRVGQYGPGKDSVKRATTKEVDQLCNEAYLLLPVLDRTDEDDDVLKKVTNLRARVAEMKRRQKNKREPNVSKAEYLVVHKLVQEAVQDYARDEY